MARVTCWRLPIEAHASVLVSKKESRTYSLLQSLGEVMARYEAMDTASRPMCVGQTTHLDCCPWPSQ